MENISFEHINITGGFWKKKQDLIKDVTVRSVYGRFSETHRFSALKCTWKEGEPDMPHIFWDSDVAKWIEGVAYILMKDRDYPYKKEAEEAIADIIKNADEYGYFNSHFLVADKDKRWQWRSHHELYCLGHLIEAAVAWEKATGSDDFLCAMCRFTYYVYEVFVEKKSAAFVTPGHPELELALVKLYKATGNRRYFELAEYFIDNHGNNEEDRVQNNDFRNDLYNQDEMLIKDRTTAEGHSVRAMYLMSAAADVAAIREDSELADACTRVFDNVAEKRMYITGGIGSSYRGEAFTIDYDLPSGTAYAETCAAISLAMFASRMQCIEADSRYADTVERVLYNGFLSGLSMDGKSFFYENPLEIDPYFNNVDTSVRKKRHKPITQRVEVFECSCCPPNIIRFVPSLADMMYTCSADTLYVHQYMASKCEFDGNSIIQTTDYPVDGRVKISCKGNKKHIALRIPGWCEKFELNCDYVIKNGYAVTDADVDEIILNMDMPVEAMRANRRVHACSGRVAVMRGPVVYCAEGVDNGEDIKNIAIDPRGSFELTEGRFMLPEIKTTGYINPETKKLYSKARGNYSEIPLTLIPYFAFANRGESEMNVWLLEK